MFDIVRQAVSLSLRLARARFQSGYLTQPRQANSLSYVLLALADLLQVDRQPC